MRYIVAAIALILLTGIACSQDGGDTTPELEPFESEAADYSLSLPPGWETQRTLETSAGRIDVFAHITDQQQVAATLAVTVNANDEMATLDFDEFAKQVLRSLGAVERHEDREVAGEQALVFSSGGDAEGDGGIQTETAFFRHGSDVWSIRLTFQGTEAGTFSAMFGPILDGFGFP